MAIITLDNIYGNEDTGPFDVHHGIFVDIHKQEARCSGKLGIRNGSDAPVEFRGAKTALLESAGLCCLICNVSLTLVTPKPAEAIV